MNRLDPITGPAAQDAARQELSRPEYRHDPGPVQRALSWIGGRLSDLVAGSGRPWALLLAVVLVLAVLAVAVARAGRPGRLARGEARMPDDPLRPASSRDHRVRAEAFTADEAWAQALREWLRAAIQTLEDRGVLDPRPGRTGAAVAREAGPLVPEAGAVLHRAALAFDEIWFGGRSASRADAEAGRAAADSVTRVRITRAVP